MSQQEQTKLDQGYFAKPKSCGTCVYKQSTRELPKWMREANERHPDRKAYTLEQYGLEKKLRCGIGSFAVKATGSCSLHQTKDCT